MWKSWDKCCLFLLHFLEQKRKAGPPRHTINNNNTMVANYILRSGVHREALKYAKENNSCLERLANVASEVV